MLQFLGPKRDGEARLPASYSARRLLQIHLQLGRLDWLVAQPRSNSSWSYVPPVPYRCLPAPATKRHGFGNAFTTLAGGTIDAALKKPPPGCQKCNHPAYPTEALLSSHGWLCDGAAPVVSEACDACGSKDLFSLRLHRKRQGILRIQHTNGVLESLTSHAGLF